MKDLNTNNTLIEGVLNSLTVEDRFEANKRFAKIKKVVLENIGYNNKVATVEDYVGIIQSVLYETPKQPENPKATVGAKPVEELPQTVTTREKKQLRRFDIEEEEGIDTSPDYENQYFQFK
jgi:hypothetical protein